MSTPLGPLCFSFRHLYLVQLMTIYLWQLFPRLVHLTYLHPLIPLIILFIPSCRLDVDWKCHKYLLPRKIIFSLPRGSAPCNPPPTKHRLGFTKSIGWNTLLLPPSLSYVRHMYLFGGETYIRGVFCDVRTKFYLRSIWRKRLEHSARLLSVFAQ